jgi:hypothetical protein
LGVGVNEIPMPHGAELLSVQIVNGEVCLYVTCDRLEERETRRILVVETGEAFDDQGAVHLGSVLVGYDLWHVFELTEPVEPVGKYGPSQWTMDS